MVAFNFAPKGGAHCNGQLMDATQNRDLYTVIQRTFGGSGQTGFNLPDLQGRTPMHPGGSVVFAKRGEKPCTR